MMEDDNHDIVSLLSKAQRIYATEGVATLLVEALKSLRVRTRRFLYGLPVIDGLTYTISKRRLDTLIESEAESLDAVDTAYRYRGVGRYRTIRPLHAQKNAEALVEVVNEMEPSVVVEIGAGYGGSFYLWTRAVPSTEVVISVDDMFRTPQRLLTAIETTAETHLIRGSSHDEPTLAAVRQRLDGREVDLLYIDGDHSYEGVLANFRQYSRFVRDGGVVVMDDVDNTETTPDVPKAWADISKGRETSLVKATDESPAHGIVYL